MKLLSVFLFLLSTSLAGCGLVNDGYFSEQPVLDMRANKHFDQKVFDLIEQLIQVEQFDYKLKSIAFTSLVWEDTLTVKNAQRPGTLLGHQISSSLRVELVQRGGKVVEHKSSQAISMSKNASYYLTRKLSSLSEDIDIDYILAGTMLAIQGGIEVHIEVIDIESHNVVSSARTFISDEFLPELNRVYMKEGKIYRGQL